MSSSISLPVRVRTLLYLSASVSQRFICFLQNVLDLHLVSLLLLGARVLVADILAGRLVCARVSRSDAHEILNRRLRRRNRECVLRKAAT